MAGLQLGFGWGRGRLVTIDDRHDRPGSRKARLHAVPRVPPPRPPADLSQKSNTAPPEPPDLGLRDDVHLLDGPMRTPLGLNPAPDPLTAQQSWMANILGIPGPIPEARETFCALVPDRFKRGTLRMAKADRRPEPGRDDPGRD